MQIIDTKNESVDMTNREITAAFQDIYNGFWVRWRDRQCTEQDFDRIYAEAVELMRKHPFRLAQDMIRDLLDELDRRHRGGNKNGKEG